MNKANSILFWFRTTPYYSSALKDGLDAALAYAAFDQEVSILFSGDASYLLIKQAPELIKQKDFQKNLKALPMYDINNIYLEKSSADNLPGIIIESPPIKIIDLKILDLKNFNQVFTF